MNVEVRTGFEKINHDIHFQSATPGKGKALAMANRVLNVVEHRINAISYVIESDIGRQTCVTLKPYNTKLYIDNNRCVEHVTCTCVYNKSERCKHIAGLIYFINNSESLSKTDQEQQWGKPTSRQYSQEKYSKGKYFHEMFSPPQKIEIEPLPVNLLDLQQPSALRLVLLEAAKDNSEYSIKALVSSMLDQVFNNLMKEECEACLENFSISYNEHRVHKNFIPIENYLQLFYENNIVLTKDEIVKLSCETLKQSQCKRWFTERRLRISASKNAHSIKSRAKKSVDSLVNDMLCSKKVNNISTVYGIENESNARKLYEKLYNCKVIQVGLLVREHQPWICASLDGVVVQDGCLSKIVEFKCPITCQDQPVVDVEGNKCNVKYLKLRNHEIALTESHVYYTQCQIQMYISGMNLCDLFVYSPVENGCCNVQVLRDEMFIEKVILKCEKFYFQYYLPALYGAFNKETYNSNNTCTTNKPNSYDTIKKKTWDINNKYTTNKLKRKFTGVNIDNQLTKS